MIFTSFDDVFARITHTGPTIECSEPRNSPYAKIVLILNTKIFCKSGYNFPLQLLTFLTGCSVKLMTHTHKNREDAVFKQSEITKQNRAIYIYTERD